MIIICLTPSNKKEIMLINYNMGHMQNILRWEFRIQSSGIQMNTLQNPVVCETMQTTVQVLIIIPCNSAIDLTFLDKFL